MVRPLRHTDWSILSVTTKYLVVTFKMKYYLKLTFHILEKTKSLIGEWRNI